MTHPDWVLKHKKKGTEVRKMGENYYLYKIRSEWDKEKKRPKKITEKYLGKITPEGLIKPKHERKDDLAGNITVKEFGATNLILSQSKDIIELLKSSFPYQWMEITAFSITRLLHQSPLKNVQTYHESSHLSDVFKAKVSPKSISKLLTEVGKNRLQVTEFMKNFIGVEHAVIDLTHVFSSPNITSSALGYNSEREYMPQVNLALLFSVDEGKKQPVFFRMVPGCVRDITVIPRTVREAGLSSAVLLGDKGFYSQDNVKFLESEELNYILPLKRDSTLIDYSVRDKTALNYLIFKNRVIWYHEYHVEDRRIIFYLDEKLRSEEERCFILNVEKGKKSMDEFYEKQHRFGTISVITNYDNTPSKIFELLKSRTEIEQSFDTFKNLLNADRSYMRDEHKMQGWMFINYVSMLMYYRIYGLLADKDMLKRFSVKDIMVHLSRISKLKVNGEWMLSEVPKKTEKLMNKLGVEMNIT